MIYQIKKWGARFGTPNFQASKKVGSKVGVGGSAVKTGQKESGAPPIWPPNLRVVASDRKPMASHRGKPLTNLALLYNSILEPQKALEEFQALESIQSLDGAQRKSISDAKSYVNTTENEIKTDKEEFNSAVV